MPAFWTWWQHIPQNLDPILFFVGSIPVYWYALFFLGGAFLVYYFAEVAYREQGIFSRTQYQDFAFGVFVSSVLGGKVGFLLFYWYPFILHKDASRMFFPHAQGLALPGMSFVGGLIAVALYIYWFAKKNNKDFTQLTDGLVLFIPVAIFLGRLGNFFHVELKGRVTEMPWGMYFPREAILRHPSTLYAALLEGILLFSLLFFFVKKKQAHGTITAWFCIGYGMLRFISEFFREPDIQIGYLGILTINQFFALGICIGGIVILSVQNAKK